MSYVTIESLLLVCVCVCVCVCRMRCALGNWREVVARREREREQAADELRHRLSKRKAWHHWREVLYIL